MHKSFLIYIPSLILGYLMIDAVWQTAGLRRFALKIFIGFGIGLGATSLLLFAWLWLTNQIKGFEWILGGLILAGILIKIFRHKNQSFRMQLPKLSFMPNWPGILLSIVFVITLWISYDNFIAYSFTHQHGDRDAQAIWNLHARIIYRDTANWKKVFSPEFDVRFHPDYPLLTSLDVVWGWHLSKTETTRIPIALAGLFTFGMIGLIFTSLINLKTWGQASLASLILMGTPFFILLGTFQTADLPFAYFVLSTIVLFSLYSSEMKPELLILAGFTAGLAAWTKNEGDLFILSAIVGCLVYGFWQKQIWSMLSSFLIGLLPVGMIIAAYKIFLAPPNDLFAGSSSSALISKLISLTRYETIFAAIGNNLLIFGNWPISILIILVIFSIIIGFRMENSVKPAARIGALILAIQLTGYIFIYVITPLPLEFHLEYSLDRLLFQLFPSALFLFFWIVSAPEQIIQQSRISNP